MPVEVRSRTTYEEANPVLIYLDGPGEQLDLATLAVAHQSPEPKQGQSLLIRYRGIVRRVSWADAGAAPDGADLLGLRANARWVATILMEPLELAPLIQASEWRALWRALAGFYKGVIDGTLFRSDLTFSADELDAARAPSRLEKPAPSEQ